MVAIPPRTNSVLETPAASTHLTEPTTHIPTASIPPRDTTMPSNMDLYFQSTAQLRKEVMEMSPPKFHHHGFGSVASTPLTNLTNLDPSKGGRGAAMGKKQAKAAYQRQQMEAEKNNRLKAIEKNLKWQAKENAKAQQVFKLRQMIKLASTLQNQRLIEKAEKAAEKEIERMLQNAEDDKAFPSHFVDDGKYK
jgi:hypothetical protein